MTGTAVNDADIFSVSAAMNFWSWLICEHPRLWQRIGNIETSIIADELDAVSIEKPVWVTGLARSGSTLLLEILAGVPGVTSQTYKDFPPVYTPYAWNSLLRYMKSDAAAAAERAHRDGIMVTLDSPEAMEEPLWMGFFTDAHDPSVSNVIAPGSHPVFAEFLRNHIRKLLAVRNGTRYLAKANYQLTRMEYLLDAFPDARFIVPVRDPVSHIASLMKQHDLFCRGQSVNERARKHLGRVGHFEFGLDRTPVNTGDSATTRAILELWAQGDEVRGWARYWAQLYRYAADRISASPALAQAAKVIDFADLCAAPAARLQEIFAHCEYEPGEEYLNTQAARIKAPGYYQPDFSDTELAVIEEETAAVVTQLKRLTATPA